MSLLTALAVVLLLKGWAFPRLARRFRKLWWLA